MGPNGSGKTTLLRALVDMAGYVSSVNWTTGMVPFLSQETRCEPTRFSLEGEWDWLSPGVVERFRLELVIGWVRADNGSRYISVSRETLVHFPRGRRRRLFERRGDGVPVYVSRDFGVRPSDDRLGGLLPTISWIATMAMFDVPLARRIASWMQGWVKRTTNIVGNDTRSLDTETAIGWIETNPDSMRWTETQLGRIDAGIRAFEVDGHDRAPRAALAALEHRQPCTDVGPVRTADVRSQTPTLCARPDARTIRQGAAVQRAAHRVHGRKSTVSTAGRRAA